MKRRTEEIPEEAGTAEELLIARTVEYVRAEMTGEGTGHDWWHVDRVWRMARRIGEEERANLTVVELASLLHDIADWKFHDGDEEIGPRTAGSWLQRNGADTATEQHVVDIIAEISFKGVCVQDSVSTLEAAVVQDADRLDAMGAIGIARTFAYGGYRGRAIYDPVRPPEVHATAEAYRANTSPTINHFHEKLLLLKNRMVTPTGRRLAEGRHRYMVEFLAAFHREWNGDE